MKESYPLLAYDRFHSVRKFDADGRLHVSKTPISKANICPYRGNEIPGWQKLKLDPERIYHLLRDPNELKKAASTFNALPLLENHYPVNAVTPRRDLIIGTTGEDAQFIFPYLTNSLTIWDGKAIENVQSGSQKELSCAYAYVPIMGKGQYQGENYDGIMTQIRGSHIALVSKGRAGPDVLVADEALSNSNHPSKNKDIMMADNTTPPEKNDKAPKVPPTTDNIPLKTNNDSLREIIEKLLEKERQHNFDKDEARRIVRPLIGDVMGMDEAEDIYKYALEKQGIDTAHIHPSAFPELVKFTLRQKSASHHANDQDQNLKKIEDLSLLAPRKI